MQAFFVYLLKVIVYSGILFGYYHIALRNKKFHYYNRFYLLMSVALSLFLPFLQLEVWSWKSSNPQVINLAAIMVTNTQEHESTVHSFSLSFNDFLILTYTAIAACLLLSFVSGLLKVIRMKKKYPSEKVGDIVFINTDLQQAPFSFFKNLFWKNSIDISDETGSRIFRHELTHIEQKHSTDKLFMQMITLVFWLNPFYWLIHKELSLIHEFIADEKAVDNKDAEAFALMLLQSQFGKNSFLPLQSFHYSPIKRRLRMLTSSSQTSYSYARRILALPLLAAVTLLFAFKLRNDDTSGNTADKANTTFTLVVDAGHGGSDDGAIATNGKPEKDINLLIAKKIADLAPEYNIDVVMTRTSDATTSLPGRMELIKNTKPDACISIHTQVNDEKGADKSGMEIYISRKDDNPKQLLNMALGSSLIKSLGNSFTIDKALLQRKEKGIYILDANPYPSALIEFGYINNQHDFSQLTDDKKIGEMAKEVLQGIVAFANKEPLSESAKEDTTWIHQKSLTDTTQKPAPLYMLDGKELSAEEMKNIDGASIKSMNVLKGDEAVKTYGKKGENGVVLITMKKTVDSLTGKNSTIKIRTQNGDAFTGIYYLDGKEVTKAEASKISGDDIESMNVWKDKEAVKKWGEKGKNGVIEIITKKQKPAKAATSLSLPAGSATQTKAGKSNDAESANQPVNAFAPPIAVTETNDEAASGKAVNGEESYDKIFTATQLSAAFPGGREAWLSYLGRHLNSGVVKNGPSGTYTVNMQFTVSESGKLEDIKALNDPGYGTAEEAVRVIKNSPAWTPAVQNGNHVASQVSQAILFYKQ